MATAIVQKPPRAAQLARVSLSNPVTTPHDYADYDFALPHDRYVGLLACQRDPHLRELETIVRRCEKRTVGSQALASRSNGKEKGKQKSKASTAPEEVLYEVELLDTVLFPEGGGQASDSGSLISLDDTDSPPIIVKEVVRRHLAAVHLCSAPIAINSRVLVKVDWVRRHDLCVQHTAQHLLSAVFEQHFKLPTLGWALSGFPNLSYVELPRCPSRDEIAECERLCNNLIIEGRRVRVEMDLSQDNRPDTLPADYIGGVVRTVVIDELDRSPCCGTHYPSLAPLQGIHVSPLTTPIRGTNTRVYFLAGPRVTQQLADSLTQLKLAGTELSCTNSDVPARVKLLSDQYRDTLRREKRLRDEIAEAVAAKAIAQARASALQDGSLVTALLREEDSTNDNDFLQSVQKKIIDSLAGSSEPFAFALAQVGNTASAPDGCLVVFANKDAIVAQFADEVKKGETKLTRRLKGGGKGRWQGKVIEGRFTKENEAELLSLLRTSFAHSAA